MRMFQEFLVELTEELLLLGRETPKSEYNQGFVVGGVSPTVILHVCFVQAGFVM